MVRRRSRTSGSRTAGKVPTFLSRTALCRLSGVDERQLTIWEHEELLVPARTVRIAGREEPVYSQQALHRIRVIRTLADDLDVNLPGIGVILNLLDQFSGW